MDEPKGATGRHGRTENQAEDSYIWADYPQWNSNYTFAYGTPINILLIEMQVEMRCVNVNGA
jgi:hypothetical protein